MIEKVSLLFPVCNRLEFTRQSWAALIANTDWSLVDEFHIYDDGSTDGTKEWLTMMHRSGPPCTHHWKSSVFRSPMGVTLDWIKSSNAPLLAKLDNDTVYPPRWLNIALDVMERHHDLHMLGLECMRAPELSDKKREYLPAKFVSGLGIYRRAIFEESLPEDHGYFGLEEWQQQRSHIKTGWILPSLPVFLLDRLPMEPWKSLSEEYVRKGWQRPWSLDLRYKPEQHAMWSWWKPV